MGRIRKKTSKRGTSNDRRKIQQKAKETRKKRARDSKKDVTWKSKHKKDPGIPNEFPYKDQVLAEVQEQRRQAEEEKERRKASKKASKVDAQSEKMAVDEEDISNLAAQPLQVKLTRMENSQKAVDTVNEDSEEEEPALFNSELSNLKTVLEHADVVLHVLDARDPLSFRSTKVEEASGKRTVYALNKIDLAPREAVAGWAAQLRKENSTALFRSATAFISAAADVKGKGKAPANDAVGVDALLVAVAAATSKKGSKEPINVAVVGFANVGKSALINSLAQRAALPVYVPGSSKVLTPTTTTLPQEVHVTTADGKKLKFVDTPGFAWESSELTDEILARDLLIRNRGRVDKMKDPMPSVVHFVSRANNEDLMVHYSLPAFVQGDVDTFLPGVARAKQMIKRRGAVDLNAACRAVLRDWSTGALRWYAQPSSKETVEDASLESVLLRKDFRKQGGAVRLTAGAADSRTPAFEQAYVQANDSEEEEEEEFTGIQDDEGVDQEEDEDDEEIDELEDDDEEEEEEVPPPPPQKQKRKRGDEETPAPVPKKVAFAKPGKAPKSSGALPKAKPANTPSSKSKLKSSLKASGDKEEYDFKKFF